MLKNVRGVWLPEEETHLTQYATQDEWCYQPHKLLEAIKWVRDFEVAVDVGAHCGLWSRMLVHAFTKVYAFEPLPLHREAFTKNVEGNYELLPYACGRESREIRVMTVPHSSGCTSVDARGDAQVQMVRVDDHVKEPCGLLKIDVEGYEELVLRGAKKLLKSKPCVIVEQKPGKAQKYGLDETGAVRYLRKKGAVVRAEIEGDWILSWDE